uniref:G_PROTEIN_RECEP_F1_2 domain-containing protein n=1 Tax=Caenorhabditis tropicalis TaxID=1561998 RepID=A0A1I7T8Z9_9PELO
MFALAIFDIISLCFNTFGTGLFDIYGITFCDYPTSIFCFGSISSGFWLSGCLTCVLLAIERCVEINPDLRLEYLFRKNVFPYVRVLLFFYTIYAVGFTKPTVFNLEYSCWFFDPLIGKDVSELG